MFWSSPKDLLSKLPKLEEDTRKAPFAIAHPVRFRQQLKYLTDPSWGYENKTDLFNTAAFDLKLEARGKPGTSTWTYFYVTKSDRIQSKTWQDTRQALKDLDDTQWIRLDRPNEDALVTRMGLDSLSDDEWAVVVAVYIIVVLLILLIYISYRASPAEAEMKLQILYPVSTAKFLIMSVGTLGFYSFYWFWQNWRWLRDVDNQNVSAFWRGLVLPAFWNFSLFRRIATQAPAARPALSRVAIPLAVLYLLISIASQVFDGDDSPLVADAYVHAAASIGRPSVSTRSVAQERRKSQMGGPQLALWLAGDCGPHPFGAARCSCRLRSGYGPLTSGPPCPPVFAC